MRIFTVVKEWHNGSCSELSRTSINSRVAALELEVDRLKTEHVKSEGQTAMIKKRPRLGKINKAFSAGDIVSICMHVYICTCNEAEVDCTQCLYVYSFKCSMV